MARAKQETAQARREEPKQGEAKPDQTAKQYEVDFAVKESGRTRPDRRVRHEGVDRHHHGAREGHDAGGSRRDDPRGRHVDGAGDQAARGAPGVPPPLRASRSTAR